jgi:LysM repeat protein
MATYTVQRGDTLSEISVRFGATVDELARRNSIRDPDKNSVGQELELSNGDGDDHGTSPGDALATTLMLSCSQDR